MNTVSTLKRRGAGTRQKCLSQNLQRKTIIAIPWCGLEKNVTSCTTMQITDPAIVAAATSSHRYIADRQLPDKAIDLIDEAASSIRMQIDSKPE